MKPFRRRRFQVFLSHAHADSVAVGRIRAFLGAAGVSVWYDAEQIPGGALFPSALADAIDDCQAMIVIVSRTSLEKQWVKDECGQGLVHAEAMPPFAVIPVCLERDVIRRADVPTPLLARSSIDAIDGRLDGAAAARLLRSVHGISDATPPPALNRRIVETLSATAGESPSELAAAGMPIVYVTCGWRTTGEERRLRQEVLESFEGTHRVGDAEDHAHVDPARIQAILRGCSGHVVAIPRRGSGHASDPEYRSLRTELDVGRSVGLPCLFVAEAGVDAASFGAADAVSWDPAEPATERARRLAERVDEARARFAGPALPHFVFVASDYDDVVVQDHVVRHVASVTGLPCLKGPSFSGKSPATKIECAIRSASLVLANIVSRSDGPAGPVVNWNTCIEAGVAVGAGRPLEILARRGPTETWSLHSLPFMLRDHSIATYGDDASLVAAVHRLVRPYRRRVLDGA